MANNKTKARTLGEIFSAAAVVVSLVFVGLEVRESARQTALNTRSLEVSAYQDLMGRIADMNETSLLNPDLALIYQDNEDATAASLSREDWERVFNWLNLRLRYGDLAFYQFELGMISEERFESAIRPLAGRLCGRLFADMWSRMKANFVEGYRAYIDQKVCECS